MSGEYYIQRKLNGTILGKTCLDHFVKWSSTQYFSKSLQWKKRKCQSWPLLLMLPKSWTPIILLLALRIQGHMKSQLWKIGNSKSWLHLLPILTAVAFGIGMFLILIGWIPMAMLSFAFGILLALIDCATKSVKKTSIQSRGKNQWQKIRPLSTTCFIWKNKSRVLVHFFMPSQSTYQT